MLSKQAVLISIHREHAERIFTGLKTLEIRKTAPAVDVFPYPIYMYETKSTGSGLVVGEFLCRGNIKTNCFDFADVLHESGADYDISQYRKYISERACLSIKELTDYARRSNAQPGKRNIVALDVSEPVRYMCQRPLSYFGITTPPQSWCYIAANK